LACAPMAAPAISWIHPIPPIALPGMTGLDLIATLRERQISAPAILITSNPSAALINRAKPAHIPIVEKPLLNDSLIEAIRAACSTQTASPH
jgi:FixJ family two-component response regulator